VELNPREIVVTNRTEQRAVALASALGAKSIPFDELAAAIADSDVVIASTGSPDAIVEIEVVARAAAKRGGEHQRITLSLAEHPGSGPSNGDAGGEPESPARRPWSRRKAPTAATVSAVYKLASCSGASSACSDA